MATGRCSVRIVSFIGLISNGRVAYFSPSLSPRRRHRGKARCCRTVDENYRVGAKLVDATTFRRTFQDTLRTSRSMLCFSLDGGVDNACGSTELTSRRLLSRFKSGRGVHLISSLGTSLTRKVLTVCTDRVHTGKVPISRITSALRCCIKGVGKIFAIKSLGCLSHAKEVGKDITAVKGILGVGPVLHKGGSNCVIFCGGYHKHGSTLGRLIGLIYSGVMRPRGRVLKVTRTSTCRSSLCVVSGVRRGVGIHSFVGASCSFYAKDRIKPSAVTLFFVKGSERLSWCVSGGEKADPLTVRVPPTIPLRLWVYPFFRGLLGYLVTWGPVYGSEGPKEGCPYKYLRAKRGTNTSFPS